MTATKKVTLSLALLGIIGLVAFAALAPEQAGPVVPEPAVEQGADFVAGETEVVEEPSFDRESFVSKMREAVLSRLAVEGEIVLPEPEPEPLPEPTAPAVTTERQVRFCDATLLESQFVASWPKTNVVVDTSEGALLISGQFQELVGTSTETALVTKTLMQLPLRPVATAESNCLTHSYIGVTLDGRLIHNNDVPLYTGVAATVQIGYAFDGYPIYGVVTDTAGVDVCGGQATANGYRYQLRADENFVLGCFTAAPQQSTI